MFIHLDSRTNKQYNIFRLKVILFYFNTNINVVTNRQHQLNITVIVPTKNVVETLKKVAKQIWYDFLV